VLALAALFLCTAFAARAQQPVPAPPAAEGKTRMLSLDDVVQMVLTNNLDIQISKYTPVIDQLALNGLFSAYDPAFSLSASRTYNSQPGQPFMGFSFPANVTVDRNYSPGLTGTLPFGLSYNLTAPLSDQTYPNSQYNASPALTLKQPILKNFLIDNTRYQIQLSRRTLRSDQLALRLQMETSVYSVKAAYYNLIAARGTVDVQSAAVKLAQQLVDENTRKVQLGALAPLDQRQAESQAASSQADLLAAELAQATQENTLNPFSFPCSSTNGATSLPCPRTLCWPCRKIPTFPNACAKPLNPAPKCSRPKSTSKSNISPSNTPATSFTRK